MPKEIDVIESLRIDDPRTGLNTRVNVNEKRRTNIQLSYFLRPTLFGHRHPYGRESCLRNASHRILVVCYFVHCWLVALCKGKAIGDKTRASHLIRHCEYVFPKQGGILRWV